jgi:16S rRNA (guanine966-N2)-methyltransferase
VVREAIFNVVGSLLPDATVLDLFAGSGALGIEALSRGAAGAVFVDQDDHAVRTIRRNLTGAGLADRARVFRSDVVRWLRTNPEEVARASLVMLDPPYNDAVLEQALALLDTLVTVDTTVVVERAHRQPLLDRDRLRPVRDRRYGDTAVTVLVAE